MNASSKIINEINIILMGHNLNGKLTDYEYEDLHSRLMKLKEVVTPQDVHK